MTNIENFIRDIPDFPKPGITFKDITPLLGDAKAFRASIDQLAESLAGLPCDAIVGIESRGFLFGAALALVMDVGFVPIRKPGKLPHDTVSREYSLEYGTDTVEMHRDGVQSGQSLIIIDDLIATGGTATAACELVEDVGAKVSALGFIIALDFIPWRDRLGDREVRALLRYS
ncbi:MAG: adenine phosphoribosyltransferase [Planctomycetota bacterium]|jgi:adenine phosphoribosyltransferase|nr:adenine phosphoribosyltransferase [Planctomycetota bacterium]